MPGLVVYHSSYGCETGCCGHRVEWDGEGDGPELIGRSFEFSHPYGDDPLEFAKEMVRDAFGEEHVKDLDWSNCLVSDE